MTLPNPILTRSGKIKLHCDCGEGCNLELDSATTQTKVSWPEAIAEIVLAIDDRETDEGLPSQIAPYLCERAFGG